MIPVTKYSKPLLRDNFIEQQQFLIQESIGEKKLKSFKRLDLLGDAFKERYGAVIMENIRIKLSASPFVELHDSAKPLSVVLFRICDINGLGRIIFYEPSKPYYGSSGGIDKGRGGASAGGCG